MKLWLQESVTFRPLGNHDRQTYQLTDMRGRYNSDKTLPCLTITSPNGAPDCRTSTKKRVLIEQSSIGFLNGFKNNRWLTKED